MAAIPEILKREIGIGKAKIPVWGLAIAAGGAIAAAYVARQSPQAPAVVPPSPAQQAQDNTGASGGSTTPPDYSGAIADIANQVAAQQAGFAKSVADTLTQQSQSNTQQIAGLESEIANLANSIKAPAPAAAPVVQYLPAADVSGFTGGGGNIAAIPPVNFMRRADQGARETAQGGTEIPLFSSAGASVSGERGVITYTIKPGDTLSQIAQRFGTNVSTLAQINSIANPNLIRAGATLTIPGSGGGGGGGSSGFG